MALSSRSEFSSLRTQRTCSEKFPQDTFIFLMRIILLLVVSYLPSMAATITYYGPAGGPVTGWDTGTDSIAWKAVSSLNDGVDGGGKLDFVGDVSNSGFFLAENASFLFFRTRVNVASAPTGTFTDAHLILIDVVGWNYPTIGQTTKPDFAFAWDSKSNDPTKHGLEMQIPSTLGVNWADIRMADIDGNSAAKTAADINTTGQGFVRTIDGQATTNFGNTTFIDFAIQKAYLTQNSTTTGNLLNAQGNLVPVNMQLASIANATDHNAFGSDIAGGFAPTSPVATSWSATVPEPSTLALAVSALLGVVFFQARRRSRSDRNRGAP